MDRTRADALRWVATGTALCRQAIAGLAERDWDAPSALPGWTRRHLVAHLAANADAVGNLVRWAATGVESPMYASAQARAEGIEQGSHRAPGELASWLEQAATQLDQGFATLPEAAWQAQIRTAQGRDLPASDIPWLRAREVMVHAVDLDTGLSFADLPGDFLAALSQDILAKRGMDHAPAVNGGLPEQTAYLAGRPTPGLTTPDGQPLPDLPPWL